MEARSLYPQRRKSLSFLMGTLLPNLQIHSRGAGQRGIWLVCYLTFDHLLAFNFVILITSNTLP